MVNLKNKQRIWIALLLVAMAVTIGYPQIQNAQAQGAGDPGAGTVVGIKSVAFADGDTAIAATTYYYGTGNGTTGQDIQYWHNADVFVTADISGTNTITVTPQLSVDGTNWTDAFYVSEGWVLPLTHNTTITNASGVTNTTTSTHTISFVGSTASRQSENVTYSVALSADGTDYEIIPLHGIYLRLKATLASAVNITPTIKVVLKNDGGR